MPGLTRERITSLVKRYRPRGWSIKASHRHETGGDADSETRTITVPRLETVWALHIFFHECGHVYRDHFKRFDMCSHQEEYEAEIYALHLMKAEGIHIPAYIIKGARENVRLRCVEDAAKWLQIDRKIARWARYDPRLQPHH